MGQPLDERGLLKAVMAVVGVAVDGLSVRILHREGHNVHCSVARDGRNMRGHHAFERVWMNDGFDWLQAEELSETVRDVYRGFAHGMAWAAMGLSGREAIQAILVVNGRRGRIVEEISSRSDSINGGYYGNPEGYRIDCG